MEVPLSYNWNVYKLFKNGKRAKSPFHVFEYDDPESVGEYFNAKVKENFTEKIRRSKMMVIRSDLPQDRPSDKNDNNDKLIQQNRNRVFRKLLKQSPTISAERVTGGLIYCKESGWEWQWAALEPGTSRYIVGLSPGFKGFDAAQKWMKDEIEQL